MIDISQKSTQDEFTNISQTEDMWNCFGFQS